MATTKSIEEKAKAYDEIVNKLKSFMAQGVDPLITRADVQDFFPELKESEGEMIRKALIRGIESVCNKEEVFIEGFTRNQIVAWLEKQGEQKPTERVEINKSLSDTVITELNKYSGENYWKSPWVLDSTGLQYPLYFANLGATWQKEQKFAEWSDKDKQMIQALNNCIEELENTNGWNYVYVDGCDDIRIETLKKWLKSFKERIKEE